MRSDSADFHVSFHLLPIPFHLMPHGLLNNSCKCQLMNRLCSKNRISQVDGNEYAFYHRSIVTPVQSSKHRNISFLLPPQHSSSYTHSLISVHVYVKMHYKQSRRIYTKLIKQVSLNNGIMGNFSFHLLVIVTISPLR